MLSTSLAATARAASRRAASARRSRIAQAMTRSARRSLRRERLREPWRCVAREATALRFAPPRSRRFEPRRCERCCEPVRVLSSRKLLDGDEFSPHNRTVAVGIKAREELRHVRRAHANAFLRERVDEMAETNAVGRRSVLFRLVHARAVEVRQRATPPAQLLQNFFRCFLRLRHARIGSGWLAPFVQRENAAAADADDELNKAVDARVRPLGRQRGGVRWGGV